MPIRFATTRRTTTGPTPLCSQDALKLGLEVQPNLIVAKPGWCVGILSIPMQITLYQIAVWFIVGLLGGSLTGLIVKGEKRGFGLQTNLLLGLGGAIVGGLIFRLFGLLPNLDKVSVSMRDIVAALTGSLLILAAYWLWQRYRPLG